MSDFVHLHVHTEYSLLDGLTKIKSLVSRVKEMEMEAVAITDHGNMYGAIEFYKECKTQGIKPLVGMEGYTVSTDHKIKEGSNKDNNHLILIAQNFTGYKNLMKISSIASVEGFYYRPRISKDVLREYSRDLICTSACQKGEVGQFLISGDYIKAKQSAMWYQEVFSGNFYLEIQRHHYKNFIKKDNDPKINEKLRQAQKDEDIWVEGIIRISRELGIPLVATNDSHYLKQTDAFAQDVLVCISTGKLVTDIERLRYVDTPTFHLPSAEEEKGNFIDIPDAVENTVRVSQKVDLQIELGKWYFPNFELPSGKTAPDYLKELSSERFSLRYPKPKLSEKDRLQYELEVIIKKGYAPYFLLMADLVNWCTERGIITNTRGSAAGSIVSYVLGITTVDPLRYNLPFERFLNPFRPKPPDIDLDIADNRREELIVHITEKYGADKVAQICTFGRMLARAAVRDVGRVLGHPYSFPDRIAKLIPLGSQGFPMTLEHAMEITPELKALYDSDLEVKRVLDLAQEIEGNSRHASVHAAGIVVSPQDMREYAPLQLEPNGEKIITQYEMHACEDIGLVKFDILGIRNLSIMGAAVEIIEKYNNKKVDFQHLPLDDKATFEMLSRGETMGTFQLGGAGMTKWLKELKPSRIEDLMVMIALFRPGPMANIPEYIARKNRRSPITYIHPKMEKFLDKSYGLLVFQEDVLFTALELAGYNWETVDKLRTAIGKKIPSEMAKQHEIFVEGCQKTSKMSKDEAEKLWNLFVPFQGYGFNKAHAASYSMVSYQTSYLKAHYPVEYMTALLTAESGNTDKVVDGIAECRRMGILVLSPDINKSEAVFSIEKNDNSLSNKSIRFGLNAIKNVGEAALEEILKARKEGEFTSFCEFYLKVNAQKVNKKVLESLIKAGTMDKFGKRSSMLAGLDTLRQKCDLLLKQKLQGQSSLFDSDDSNDGRITPPPDNFPPIDEFKKEELMQSEKELLGFYLTDNPLTSKLSVLNEEVGAKIKEVISNSENIDQRVVIGGILTEVRTILTKKNNSEMAFATIEDDTAKVDLVVFPKIFIESRGLWIREKIIIVEGRLESKEKEKEREVDEETAVEIENFSIIVDSGREISQEDNGKYDFVIRVPRGTSSSILFRLNNLLKGNPGDKYGVLIFENGRGAKKFPLSFGIDYNNEFKAEIDQILKKNTS